ncbi:MAG: type IV secretion system protein [Pseudomonadota bacterium]
MGFFAEFSAWLNAVLGTYIADNTAKIAATIEPAVVTMGVLYVMLWGVAQLTGQSRELLLDGIKRLALLALILAAALHLWLYNAVIVDTFFAAPAQLAAVIIGAYDPIDIVDQIIFRGGDVAALLIQKGGVFDGNFAFYLAGFGVYIVVGLTAIYVMFLLTLSRLALSVLLALGPLFLALLLFPTTRRFFESWVAQLANYAFITILTVLMVALMLTLLATAAEQAASTGGEIQIAHAVRVCLAAGLTFLVMRQVMPMSAGLASGLALSTYGLVSGATGWALGQSRHFGRGLMDRDTTRWDPLSRRAGYLLRAGSVGAVSTLLARSWRENSVRK